MSDSGYVYVLMNPSMPNLVKIGKTAREPEVRAKELSSTTGVPTPFSVVYDNYFKSCSQAEKHIHSLLENKGYRVSENREFFEIPIKDAIDAVVETKEYFGKFEKNDSEYNFEDDEDIEPWADILDIAEGYHYGLGDYIQDDDDAIKYYLKAIKLGYIEGYESIAMIYDDKEDYKKGFSYYKEGAQKGCAKCYSGMGSYYLLQENNLDKALKSYSLYMKNVPIEELFYIDIYKYLALSLKDVSDNNGKDFDYFEKTLPYKKDILLSLREYSIFLPCYYKSFWDIHQDSHEKILQEYKRHNNTNYMYTSYFATFRPTESFFKYIELIYTSGYISPTEIDDPFFEADLREVPTRSL